MGNAPSAFEALGGQMLTWLWHVSWPLALMAPGAHLAILLARRGSAAFRYAIWWTVLAAALLCHPAGELLNRLGLAAFPGPAIPCPQWGRIATPAPPRDTLTAHASGPGSGVGEEADWGPVEVPPESGLPLGERPDPAAVLFVLWAGGAALLVARLLLAERAVARLRRRAAPLEAGEVCAVLDALADRMDVKPPEAARAHGLALPVAVGVWRPCILLPARADPCLSGQGLQAVLAHELAHVRRRDALANLAEHLLEALLWFHPMLWMVTARLRLERERVCDDWVLAVTEAPHAYARCLTVLAERHPMALPTPASLSALRRASSLGQRVAWILDERRAHAPRLAPVTARATAAAGLVAVLVVAQGAGGGDAALQPAGEARPVLQPHQALPAVRPDGGKAPGRQEESHASEQSAAAVMPAAGLLPAGARLNDLPALVRVDCRANCLRSDCRRVARRVHLTQGRYRLEVEEGAGIVYGQRQVYQRRRPVNVLLKLDPTRVLRMSGSVTRVPVGAAILYWPEGHYDLTRMEVLVSSPTDVYAFLIDRRAGDNAGGAMLRVQRLEGDAAKPVARVWVDARRNCLSVDLRRVARAFSLPAGSCLVTCSDGSASRGAGRRGSARATTDVLLDFDPARVSLLHSSCGEPGEGAKTPLAAAALYAPGSGFNLKVHRRTTVYAYVMRPCAAASATSVQVEVRQGAHRS